MRPQESWSSMPSGSGSGLGRRRLEHAGGVPHRGDDVVARDAAARAGARHTPQIDAQFAGEPARGRTGGRRWMRHRTLRPPRPAAPAARRRHCWMRPARNAASLQRTGLVASRRSSWPTWLRHGAVVGQAPASWYLASWCVPAGPRRPWTPAPKQRLPRARLWPAVTSSPRRRIDRSTPARRRWARSVRAARESWPLDRRADRESRRWPCRSRSRRRSDWPGSRRPREPARSRCRPSRCSRPGPEV